MVAHARPARTGDHLRRFNRRRLGRTVRRHRAFVLAAGIAVAALVGVLGLAALTGAFSARPAADTYTFTADWTLLDLERHVEAGEVATIAKVSARPPQTGTAAESGNVVTDVLAAKTTS